MKSEKFILLFSMFHSKITFPYSSINSMNWIMRRILIVLVYRFIHTDKKSFEEIFQGFSIGIVNTELFQFSYNHFHSQTIGLAEFLMMSSFRFCFTGNEYVNWRCLINNWSLFSLLFVCLLFRGRTAWLWRWM